MLHCVLCVVLCVASVCVCVSVFIVFVCRFEGVVRVCGEREDGGDEEGSWCASVGVWGGWGGSEEREGETVCGGGKGGDGDIFLQ